MHRLLLLLLSLLPLLLSLLKPALIRRCISWCRRQDLLATSGRSHGHATIVCGGQALERTLLSLLVDNVGLRVRMSQVLVRGVILHRVCRRQSKLRLQAGIHVRRGDPLCP